MSQQKFASNVIEKCLAFGNPVERQILIGEMLGSTNESEHLEVCILKTYTNQIWLKICPATSLLNLVRWKADFRDLMEVNCAAPVAGNDERSVCKLCGAEGARDL